MISTNDIKRLREQTGAGVLDCREALRSGDGDVDRALEILREKGAAVIEKRAHKEVTHGYVATYSHQGFVGVLVELRCETDFVSENQGFRDLAHEIALQVAATSPQWVCREDVPANVAQQVAADERDTATKTGKPEPIVQRIVAGKLERFYRDNCLLEQTSIRDDKVTVSGLIQDKALAFGERIHVHRFARLAIDS